ncbi:MAG: hypothetical protein ACAH82_09810 [Solirubrobacteraceae bacterium]
MIDRLPVGLETAAPIAARVRAMLPAPAAVREVVAGIIASIADAGDDALRMH